MGASLGTKIRILCRVTKIIKNWHMFVVLYFHLAKGVVVLETRNGIKISLRAASTDLMAFINVWILHEYLKPGFEIKDDDIIIDIGAHVGLFALYAAQYCKTGKIFCFEPIKDNFDLLVENIHLNKLTNVSCFNNAVSGKDKAVKIYLNSVDQAAHSVYGIGGEYVEVNAITLNHIIDTNQIKVCNLLKLDCEGSEYEIFQSTPDDYLQKIQKICMEYHILKNNYEPLYILKKRLLSLNFQIIDNSTTKNLGMLYAKK
ncbi:MAG: FkbM family methyltransferase [Thermoproteota archaeon]